MINKTQHRKNILLVDDDYTVTQMLTLLLETRGYHVNIARSGKEILSNNQLMNTDLILLDLILPDQEGFQVCQKLKADHNTRHIPIIVLSGKVTSKNKVECLHVGADDYITKPFEYEELVARIEAVLRRSTLYHGDGPSSQGETILLNELKRIIFQEQIVPFFQPIFFLKSSKLLGLEILCRAKTDSLLSNPELLFKTAIEFGVYQELEILSWRKALEYIARYSIHEQLFLNCNPYLVEGAKFSILKSLFEDIGINANRVCLEITERSAISDYKAFYERLTEFRKLGFKFAVDDVGGGYASLESIVETRPEVVKIDRHIITNLSKDSFKRSIVKFIVSFCQENKILSIAEGIESKEDLEIVSSLGVDAVQGYYLHRPTPTIEMDRILLSSKII